MVIIGVTILVTTYQSPSSNHHNELEGYVISVVDGDTLTLNTPDKSKVRVRLAKIDAPEKKQTHGIESRQRLREIAYNASIQCRIQDIDKYGRAVAECFNGNVNVNLAMVEGGFAWFYRDYGHGDKDYDKAEARAKQGKLGLWANNDPVAPWEYRKNLH